MQEVVFELFACINSAKLNFRVCVIINYRKSGAFLMKMYMDDGKKTIPDDEAEEVDLEEAIKEMYRFPTEDSFEGNFIGFHNTQGDTIQFVRFSENEWLVDVPVLKDGKYSHSLQDTITHSKAIEILKQFYQGKEWQNLCNLTPAP